MRRLDLSCTHFVAQRCGYVTLQFNHSRGESQVMELRAYDGAFRRIHPRHKSLKLPRGLLSQRFHADAAIVLLDAKHINILFTKRKFESL